MRTKLSDYIPVKHKPGTKVRFVPQHAKYTWELRLKGKMGIVSDHSDLPTVHFGKVITACHQDDLVPVEAL